MLYHPGATPGTATFGVCPQVRKRAEHSRAAKRGSFKRGCFPILDLSFLFCPFLSFLGLSRFFPDFPDLSGDSSGIFLICPFPVSLGLLTAPTRNSPERVRDTIWTFPEKCGKPAGLETPRFSFSQNTVSGNTLANLFPLTAFRNAPNPKVVQNLSQRLLFGVPVRGPKICEKFVKICLKITVFRQI